MRTLQGDRQRQLRPPIEQLPLARLPPPAAAAAMPSTQLFGCRLRQLATDFMPMYFLTAVVQVVWLFI